MGQKKKTVLIIWPAVSSNKTDKKQVFTSVMSHTFTLTGHSSVLSADFYPPIELSKTHKYGLALIGFYTYNSIFNVTEKNNYFGYVRNDEDPNNIHYLIIPPGAYEISEMGKAMLMALKEDSKDRREGLFSLEPNNNTLKCEMMSKFNIFFPSDRESMGTLLGFQSGLHESGETHHSIYNVDIMKVRIIRVDCNIISGAYLNSAESHTLFEFDIDVEPGYKISIEPQNNIYMPIIPEGRQFIDNISIRLLDDDGDLIDFRGEKIIVKLELKQIL